MRMFRFLSIFAVVGLLSVSASAYQLHKLSNGLEIVTEENHSSKAIAVSIWVKVGSIDESEKEAGISHLIEHMTFRGSKHYKSGYLAKVVEENGGNINAFTSKSETVYHFVAPSEAFGKLFPVLADAVINPTFDSVLLEKEKKPVLEEYRMDRDNPSRRFIDEAIGKSYLVKQYGRPTIGYPENIKRFTRADLLNYHNRWYVPNNMIVVVVGDFDTASVIKKIRKLFGKLKAVPVVHKRPPAEPHGFRFFHINARSESEHLFLSYPIPDIRNPDAAKLDLLAEILGESESNRLKEALIENGALADSVYAYAMTPEYPGLFIIQAVCLPKNIVPVYKTIFAQIRKIQADGVSKTELDDARLSLIADFIRQRSTIAGRAMQLGQFAIMNMLNFESQYIRRLKSIRPVDIKQAARRYLNPAHLSVGTLYKKQIVRATTIRKLAFKKIPSIHRFVLKNGIKVIIKENHSAETVSVVAAFKGGQLLEPKGKEGISHLTAAMLTRGAAGYSRKEILKKLDKTAASISGFSGRNSLGLSGDFLSIFFRQDFRLFINLLLHPTFPDNQLKIVKKETLDSIKNEQERLTRILFKNVDKYLYHNHPYSFDELGNKDTIGAIKREDLINFYQKIAVPKNMVISIVGDVDTKTALQAVKSSFSKLKSNLSVSYPSYKLKPEYKPVYLHKNVLQSHIAYSWITGGIKSENRPALDIISAALSGQSGILFTDLRDKHGTSYVVTSFTRPGIGVGSFVIYLATRKGNLKRSLTLLDQELGKLEKNGLSRKRIEAAKDYIIGNTRLSLLSNSSQAENYALNELYGLGYLYNRRYIKTIKATTDKKINALLRQLFDSRHLVVILGPDKP